MNNDNYELICSILLGDYWTQYNNLTNKKIKLEFDDMLAMEDEYKKEIIEELFIRLFPEEAEKPIIDFSEFGKKKLKKI